MIVVHLNMQANAVEYNRSQTSSACHQLPSSSSGCVPQQNSTHPLNFQQEQSCSSACPKRTIEPVIAKGICVRSVGEFKSASALPPLALTGGNFSTSTDSNSAGVSSQQDRPPLGIPGSSFNRANSFDSNGNIILRQSQQTSTNGAMHRQFTGGSSNAGEINTDDEFTIEELQDFAQAFKMFDKDSNGWMNIKELGVAMRTLGMNPTEEELLNMVNEYDIDGNGKIDFGEFCKMMKEMQKETDQELIRLAFKVFDKDGNGFITAQEFRRFMTTMGEKFSEEEVDEIIREFDKDGDEQIDYEEFVNAVAPIVNDGARDDAPFLSQQPPSSNGKS